MKNNSKQPLGKVHKNKKQQSTTYNIYLERQAMSGINNLEKQPLTSANQCNGLAKQSKSTATEKKFVSEKLERNQQSTSRQNEK